MKRIRSALQWPWSYHPISTQPMLNKSPLYPSRFRSRQKIMPVLQPTCRTGAAEVSSIGGHTARPLVYLLLLVHAMLVLIGGCAAGRSSGLAEQSIEPPRRDTADSLRVQAEQAWLERADPDRLQEAIIYFKRAHETDRTDREILTRLARALYFQADGYLEDVDERLLRYDQGAYYGEKALSLNPAFRDQLRTGTPLIDALAVLGDSDLEPLYWTASNLGKWSKLKGIPTVIANKDLIRAMLEKVSSLDESFYYAATSRYWGAFYAAAPSVMGGDLKKSQAYFERAISLAPNFFAIRVLMAELYCVKMKDRACFRQQLEFVLQTEAQILSDVIPEQRVEQRKARELLEREAELFAR